jgi:hypothetical protein
MEIQAAVTKKSERDALFRFVHANHDKEKITVWRWKLRDFLQLFTVRPIIFAWSSLIDLFQAEVVVNTHVNLSGVRDDVSKIQEEINGQVRPVSASWIQSVEDRRMLTVPRLNTGQQLRPPIHPVPHICI